MHIPKPVTVNFSQAVVENQIAMRLRLETYVVDTQREKTFVSDVTSQIHEAFRKEGIQPPAILHREIGAATEPLPA